MLKISTAMKMYVSYLVLKEEVMFIYLKLNIEGNSYVYVMSGFDRFQR